MAAPMEVLLTTDSSGILWNACAWDAQSGTALVTYKGGCSGPQSFCCLKRQFILTAAVGKPIIHVWSVNSKEQQQRIVCPGVVSCLASSDSNTLCAAGISEKIHIWQACSGDLLAVLSHHYQKVSCLCFTDDGSHLVSGGWDNLVMVWYVASILQQDSNVKISEPLHVWSNHALPITDVYCGTGGSRSRVVSASHDQTCKLWDIATGQLLCNFVFDSPVCSVTMDTAEYHLFAGCSDGNIYQAHLFNSPTVMERHIHQSEDTNDTRVPVFKGHCKPVTCLSVSMDGTLLASGSGDNTASVWHVNSKQRIRTLNHKGAVTNLAFMPSLTILARNGNKPTFPLQSFKRHLLDVESDGDGNAQREVGVRIPYQEISSFEETRRNQDKEHFLAAAREQSTGSSKKPTDSVSQPTVNELQDEIQHLTQTNRLLFASAVELVSKFTDSR